ncbi:ArsR family transcriptional regulator [Chromatiales bacterium (ex Bugula neritina AB1)]|nr:ArsR family transcriptional regulator [Chromatiales bacterium (ex Bugula neritina AB1)]
MEQLLTGLRAAGEPTRLRLLALCAYGELSVSELTQILGQSQPRVSRHLKLLVEAGLLQRFREGAQVFYRIADRSEEAHLARTVVDLLPPHDSELNRDLQRLDQVKQRRADLAHNYFRENAARWSEIRALHVPEVQLERELLEVVGDQPVADFLDIGTGTGRVLELLASRAERGMGIDLSQEMLTVARANLEKASLRNVHVRQADMYNMPLEDDAIDLATLHLVLHYSDSPARVIEEAARVLRTNGRLVIVDFEAHNEEHLRLEHQHHRLGFEDTEIDSWFAQNGLDAEQCRGLQGSPLTVKIWQATKRAQVATG